MTVALSARAPGARVRSVDIDVLEAGTNARARAVLSYSRGAGPPSVFVKCAGSAGHRLALLALGALTVEARLADSGLRLPIEHPVPYGAGMDRRRLATVVVMDDVVAAGGSPNTGTVPLTVADVSSGLEGLARLHAAYWAHLPSSLGFLRPWRLGHAWSLVSKASLARGRRRLSELSARPRMPRGLRVGHLGDQFRRSAVLASTGEQTMLHGDPHPGNTYVPAGGGTGFLDWQLARTGHWSHDVGYFLVGSLGVTDRRDDERRLLAGYLDALGRAGVRPPDWDAAWARYRATPAFGLATWLHTLSFGSFQPPDACLALLERFATAYEDLETARSVVARDL